MSKNKLSQRPPSGFTANGGDGRVHSENATPAILLGLLAGFSWLIWRAVRSALLALLLILEPIVAILLTALALLGTLTAFFWKLASNRADFPFFLVLGASLACFFGLALYRGLIHLLRAPR